ncbi:MAG: hypothetical protein WCJ26_14765, partial [bacterium]
MQQYDGGILPFAGTKAGRDNRVILLKNIMVNIVKALTSSGNWFFTILLSVAALSLAGTAAYFSVFGLSKLFYSAGLGIVILAASLEFAKIVTVSYVYRYWKSIKKFLRIFYIFAVVFIMFLTSVGVYGFLTGAYQQSASKLEMRDSKISLAENKKTQF